MSGGMDSRERRTYYDEIERVPVQVKPIHDGPPLRPVDRRVKTPQDPAVDAEGDACTWLLQRDDVARISQTGEGLWFHEASRLYMCGRPAAARVGAATLCEEHATDPQPRRAAWALAYPKIPGLKGAPTDQCLGFVKLDGTCVACAWTRTGPNESGFGKFTTRRGDVIERDHPVLGEVYTCFDAVFGPLGAALDRSSLGHHVSCYFEFLGPSSFAGLHKLGEQKRLVLIDVAIPSPSGPVIVGPAEFLDLFKKVVEIPKIVWRGRLAGKAVEHTRSGHLLPAGAEGVVFKGGTTGSAWAVKVKTEAWERKLADTFKDGKWRGADAIERGVDEDGG